MNKKDISFIVGIIIFWRLSTLLFVLITPNNFPLQNNFLGGGLANYLKAPWFWGWLNFDGEHYFAITQRGYQSLTYFYFPLYPMVLKSIYYPFHFGFHTTALGGIIFSNILLILGLIGLWKLINLDYPKIITQTTILLILTFPTSFYFGSYYTESLFLTLVVWSIFLSRQKKWLFAGFLAGLASATRLIGIALLPVLFYEMIRSHKFKFTYKTVISLILAPLGLIIYMIYLFIKTGDPLEFFHNVTIFGSQRQAAFIVLPQVFYRYVFKILPTINYDFFPVVFTSWIEFITAILFGGLIVLGILKKKFKLRGSYLVFLFLGYIIPTLSGSFSSLPRYVLVLFPGFILIAQVLVGLPKTVRVICFLFLYSTLAIASMLFIRGYWIS